MNIYGLEDEDKKNKETSALVQGAIGQRYGLSPGLDLQALREAQDQAAANQFVAEIGKAGAGIGSAIARVPQRITPTYDEIIKSSNQPVEDLQTLQRHFLAGEEYKKRSSLSDPNSFQSKIARNLAMRQGGLSESDIEGLSAADLSGFAEAPLKSIAEAGRKRTEQEERIKAVKELQEQRDKAALERSRVMAGQKKEVTAQKQAVLSDKQTESINDFDSAISNASDLLSTYKPEYTGPLSQFKSGMIGKQFSNPEAVSYHSKIGRLTDVYRRMVTGAAAADKELARIESRLPQTSDPADLFVQKTKDYIGEVQKAKERYLGNLERKGKSVEAFRAPQEQSLAQKTITKKMFSPSRNQTKIIYSDGSEEILDGKR